jgi:hypothetical protein
MRQKFHHRSPEPAQAVTLVEPFSNRGIQENAPRNLAYICGQVGAALHLEEELAGEQLAVCREGLKCGNAGSQTMHAVPGREDGFPKQTEYRSTAAAQSGKHHAL